ncbi:MAG: cytochrome c family protein [Desulfarculaceae bacterium]|nr:cytochrome c family protein [Desulfarculaceae bacterium]
MIRRALRTSLVILFLAVPVSGGAENGKLVIEGGRKGDVSFPHGMHQKTLENCSICHAKFPKQSGAIKAQVENGKLKRMEIMKDCINCHKELAAKGKAAGPERSCNECHSAE